MQPLLFDVRSILDVVGGTLSFEDVLPETEFTLGHDVFTLEDGLAYDLLLMNTGDALLLTGSVTAHAIGECARCLEPVSFTVTGQLEDFFVRDAQAAARLSLEEDEFGLVSDEDTVDASDALLAALAIEMPLVLLCDEDCKGLCPSCGVNLNEENCSCGNEGEAFGANNPFATLKGLIIEE